MKHIKQLQAILLNKDDLDNEYKDYKNVWGLMMFIMSSDHSNDYKQFKVNLSPNVVGFVLQHNDNNMKCHLIDLSFQSEYSETELKELIIEDIKQEYINEFVPEYLISDIKVLNIMWKYLSDKTREMFRNVIGIRYGSEAEKLIVNKPSFREQLNKQIWCMDEWKESLIALNNYYTKMTNDIKELDNELTSLEKTSNNEEIDRDLKNDGMNDDNI